MELVVVGRIGAPYGVKGWVKITSYTEPKEHLFGYEPWTLRVKSRPDQQVELSTHRAHQDGFVVAIKGIDDREDVGRLSGSEVLVDAAKFPTLPKDEYYWRTLIGLQVINQADVQIGEVKSLLATGAHDVLVIENGSREILIPFACEYVTQVDTESVRIRVNWDLEW